MPTHTYLTHYNHIPVGTTFVTSTTSFDDDGDIAQLVTKDGQKLFKKLSKIPDVNSLIQSSGENEIWNSLRRKREYYNDQSSRFPLSSIMRWFDVLEISGE